MNEHRNPSHSRRALVLAAASASIGVLVAKRAIKAQQTSVPHLDEKNLQARALGYTHEATQVDPKENEVFKPVNRRATWTPTGVASRCI